VTKVLVTAVSNVRVVVHTGHIAVILVSVGLAGLGLATIRFC
jgi:hypothetical protein